MKIVTVVDDENYIVPLEFGNSIMVIDSDNKDIKEYENPGFGATHGGKERAMAGIISLRPDAIVVKEGTLCPGSYYMSRGRMKYIPTGHEKLDEVMKNLKDVSEQAVPELDPIMYQE
ncbi:MAG: hypothetical protein M1151_03960 [Candidatus Thermoplasmatota archaeon]|jgi:hypothetical protein|nr:hypothetical protein [Candidatus Thermoplasmatota archaeon]MCL5785811.1 hypothetical protein [Candidatus Thermoplasmatota archaeon]